MNVQYFILLYSPDNQQILINTNILNDGLLFQFSRLNENGTCTRYPKPFQSSAGRLEKLRVPEVMKEFLTLCGTQMFIDWAHNTPPFLTKQIQTTPFLFIQNYFQFYFLFYFQVFEVVSFLWVSPTKPSKHSPSPWCVLHAPVVSSCNLIYVTIVKFCYFSYFPFFVFPLRPSICVSKKERTSGVCSCSQPCLSDVLQLATLSDSLSVRPVFSSFSCSYRSRSAGMTTQHASESVFEFALDVEASVLRLRRKLPC